jgi:RimJ/RimL family protein N-acetyltransferase
MQQAHAPRPAAPLAPFTIETANFVIRFLRPEDATERWAAWFASAYVREALNMDDRPRTKADMQVYIASFDQSNRLLLGVFDKTNNLLVCIGSAKIDWNIGNYLINTVVGEEAYRNAGVMSELTPPFRDYFFDALGLKTSTASALGTNTVIRKFLENTGWSLAQVLKNHTKSLKDGSMIDLYLYKLTREAWAEWRRAHPELPRAKLTHAVGHR